MASRPTEAEICPETKVLASRSAKTEVLASRPTEAEVLASRWAEAEVLVPRPAKTEDFASRMAETEILASFIVHRRSHHDVDRRSAPTTAACEPAALGVDYFPASCEVCVAAGLPDQLEADCCRWCVAAELEKTSVECDDDDDNYQPMAVADKRAKFFLGKRPKYFLGK